MEKLLSNLIVSVNRQQKIMDEIIPNHNKYYFKFLGFLETFISVININLETMH